MSLIGLTKRSNLRWGDSRTNATYGTSGRYGIITLRRMESAGAKVLCVDEADTLRASLPLNPNAQNLVARDGDEWRDVTASFSEILVPIAEFLRRPTVP